jgi:hypothetical protein
MSFAQYAFMLRLRTASHSRTQLHARAQAHLSCAPISRVPRPLEASVISRKPARGNFADGHVAADCRASETSARDPTVRCYIGSDSRCRRLVFLVEVWHHEKMASALF